MHQYVRVVPVLSVRVMVGHVRVELHGNGLLQVEFVPSYVTHVFKVVCYLSVVSVR